MNITGLGVAQRPTGIFLLPISAGAAAAISALRRGAGCAWSELRMGAVPETLNADLLVAAPADADGLRAVLLEFRASWQRNLVPLVVVLPDAERAQVLDAYESGADFVATPEDSDNLLVARVRGLLHLRTLVRLLFESRNRAKSRLEQHQRWARSLVHDMRNPLAVVKAGLESIQEVGGLVPDDRELLDELGPEVNRLCALVSDLLDHERLQDGVLVPALQPVDLARLVRDVVGRSEALGRAREITVRVASPEHVEATADPALVERVLENLLGNAVRHSPSGEVVDVEVAQEPSAARVAIVNSGLLIPPELREAIFKPYVQLSEEHRPHGASGLGLAFCREVVAAHGGTIAAGERAGRTCFTVALPR